MCCPEKVMFSKQYHMAPSTRKVLGSNGCVASRRLCKRHCISPSPGKLSFLFFLFFIACLSLFFWVNSLKFSWVCICFLFSFFFSLLSFSFFAMGQGLSPWDSPFGVEGFLFSLDPHMVECNGFFPSSLSLFPKEGGNIELGSCVAGGTLPSRA